MSSSVLIVKDSLGTGLVHLAADGDGKLGVVDSEAVIAIQDVDTSVQGVDTSVQAVDTSVQSVDTSVGLMSAKLPGSLGQTTMANSMAVVLASDQSAIPVTSSASSLSSTNTVVFNAHVILDGTTNASTAVDLDAVRDAITIFGNTTNTTDSITIQVSHNNSNWYDLSSEYVNPDFLTGDFGVTINSGARYLRINKENSSGASETITANISYKI